MVGRTDIEYTIVCRRDIAGTPWTITARNESGYFDMTMRDTKPTGNDIQDFMDYTEDNA